MKATLTITIDGEALTVPEGAGLSDPVPGRYANRKEPR